MNPSVYKKKKNNAKAKFRSNWKEKRQLNNSNNYNNKGINEEGLYNLNDSKEFPSLNGEIEIKKIRAPKIKYALAFGFLGTSYHGYQKQVEYKTGIMDKVKTVEGTMENCLIQVGGIDESFRNMTYKLQMSKTSRTDKGVHAACTYIGGKFNIEPTESDTSNETLQSISTRTSSQSTIDSIINIELDENIGDSIDKTNVVDSEICTPDRKLSKEEMFVKRLNTILPEDIRCFKIQRVTKGFDARSMCSKRKYEYVLPGWVLCRRYQIPNEEHMLCYENINKLFEENADKKEQIKLVRTSESMYESVGGYTEIEIDFERFEGIVKQYEGTHDFHNFTVKQKIETQNTQRYIHKVSVKKDQLEELEVIKIMIVGQSFLYNQIRKMISLALQVYLRVCPENTIRFSLNKYHSLNINVVPSEGLILHHPYFESYNITRCNPPDVPYIDYKDVKSEVETFKNQFIYPEIKRSIESNIWEGWLENIAKYPFYLDNQDVTGILYMVDDKKDDLLGGPPYLSHLLTNPENPVVFMDVSLGSQHLGRLKIELFADKVPRTCENFRKFCTGEFKQNMVPVGYKNTRFLKVIKDYMVQGGDFVKGDGTGCVSIYGSSFDDENFEVKHDKLGVVSMHNNGPNTNGCQFFFVTKPCDWLDGKNVAFGTLVDDESRLVLQKMHNVSVGENYVPKLKLVVTECGQL